VAPAYQRREGVERIQVVVPFHSEGAGPFDLITFFTALRSGQGETEAE
jgi:hypothetical protein